VLVEPVLVEPVLQAAAGQRRPLCEADGEAEAEQARAVPGIFGSPVASARPGGGMEAWLHPAAPPGQAPPGNAARARFSGVGGWFR